jgi:hypothetical protein
MKYNPTETNQQLSMIMRIRIGRLSLYCPNKAKLTHFILARLCFFELFEHTFRIFLCFFFFPGFSLAVWWEQSCMHDA